MEFCFAFQVTPRQLAPKPSKWLVREGEPRLINSCLKTRRWFNVGSCLKWFSTLHYWCHRNHSLCNRVSLVSIKNLPKPFCSTIAIRTRSPKIGRFAHNFECFMNRLNDLPKKPLRWLNIKIFTPRTLSYIFIAKPCNWPFARLSVPVYTFNCRSAILTGNWSWSDFQTHCQTKNFVRSPFTFYHNSFMTVLQIVSVVNSFLSVTNRCFILQYLLYRETIEG